MEKTVLVYSMFMVVSYKKFIFVVNGLCVCIIKLNSGGFGLNFGWATDYTDNREIIKKKIKLTLS